MKLLITGGCGFLGSNLARFYLDQGAEVIIIDALFRAGGAANLAWLQQRQKNPSQIGFFQCDLADAVAVEDVFKKHAPFDFVCHVGGQVAMTTSLADPRRDMLTNVVGTVNILECVRKYSPGAFVAYSSTNKVYGDLERLEYVETNTRYTVPQFPVGFDETLPLDFSTPYGCSRGAADQYVRDWHRVYGIKTVVFRHSSIFGGRQYATFDQGWIGWFCQQAMTQRNMQKKGRRAEPFTIAGSGKQVRDVLHADDLVALYWAAYVHRDKCAGEIFNIGGGLRNSLSLLELFFKLAEILNCPPLEYVQTPARKSDQQYFVANVQKADRLLGWTPQVQVQHGLKKMLEWTEGNGSKHLRSL